MLSEGLKTRLLVAFHSVQENIPMCRSLLAESSLRASKKEEILCDFNDIEKIMETKDFENINAIEEAIIALNYVKACCAKLPREKHLMEHVTHILQWLNYIKRILSDEGLVPGDMGILEDHRPREPPIQRTSGSRYFYTDDTGNTVPWRLEEGEFSMPGSSHLFRM